MNQQTAMKQIEELEAKHAEEIAKLKAIIEAPDTSELVFVPKEGEKYEYVIHTGVIFTAKYQEDEPIQQERLENGNVFRIGTAKNSAKYYIMNSEYDYWLPWSGQPKPKVLPKGVQFFDTCWKKYPLVKGQLMSETNNQFVLRWKRSEQV